jgi:hypothetical protein
VAPAAAPPTVTLRVGPDGHFSGELLGRDSTWVYLRMAGKDERIPLVGVTWTEPRGVVREAPAISPEEGAALVGGPAPAVAAPGSGGFGRAAVAVQLGYAAPWGNTSGADGARFSRFLASSAPLQAELALRIGHGDALGVFAAYGFARPGGPGLSCDDPYSCDASHVRMGFTARHAFTPDGPLVVSAALALGWEWARLEVEEPTLGGSITQSLRARGPLAGLQLAAQRALGRTRIGPFLQVTVGQFSSTKVSDGDWNELNDRAFHGFLEAGLRVDLGG